MGCMQSKAAVSGGTKRMTKAEKIRADNLKQMEANKKKGNTPLGHDPYELPTPNADGLALGYTGAGDRTTTAFAAGGAAFAL